MFSLYTSTDCPYLVSWIFVLQQHHNLTDAGGCWRLLMLTDLKLSCRDCRSEFTFTTGEQEFYKNKGLGNEPKRCPNCRLVMRIKRNGRSTDCLHEVPCSGCGCTTKVPFEPKGYKPIFCNACYQVKKQDASPLPALESCFAQLAAPELVPSI